MGYFIRFWCSVVLYTAVKCIIFVSMTESFNWPLKAKSPATQEDFTVLENQLLYNVLGSQGRHRLSKDELSLFFSPPDPNNFRHWDKISTGSLGQDVQLI